MNNLIETWLAVELAVPGRTRADALIELNAECGTNYRHSELSRWMRGVRRPSEDALRYMRHVAIGKVLRDEGVTELTDEQLDRIADRMG